MTELTLYVDAAYVSPWALSAFVALEEKQLPYRLQPVDLAQGGTRAAGFPGRTHRIPTLTRGAFALAESVAIAEYLAESFPFPKHPRLYPENLDWRGTCRELQGWYRTALTNLRRERPTSTLWGPRATTPLSPEARADAGELIAVLTPLLSPGKTTLFDAWCIADTDTALMLQRLNLNGEALPPALKAYAEGQWVRPSVQKWHALPRA